MTIHTHPTALPEATHAQRDSTRALSCWPRIHSVIRLLGGLACCCLLLVGVSGAALAAPPTATSVTTEEGSGNLILIGIKVCDDDNECTLVSVGVDGRSGFWVVETTDSDDPEGPSSSASGNAGDSKVVRPDGPNDKP